MMPTGLPIDNEQPPPPLPPRSSQAVRPEFVNVPKFAHLSTNNFYKSTFSARIDESESPPPIPPKTYGLQSNYLNSQLSVYSSHSNTLGPFQLLTNSASLSPFSFPSPNSSSAASSPLGNPFLSSFSNASRQMGQETNNGQLRNYRQSPDILNVVKPNNQSSISWDNSFPDPLRNNGRAVAEGNSFQQVPDDSNIHQNVRLQSTNIRKKFSPQLMMAKKNNNDLIDLTFWDRDDTSPRMGDLRDKMGDSILDIFDPLAADDTPDRSSDGPLVVTNPPSAQSDAGNPWLLQDDTLEMPDPFDLEALQKASELARFQDSGSSCTEERFDSAPDADNVKRHRTLQSTLKYRRRINSIYDSIDSTDANIEPSDDEISTLCESVKKLRQKYPFDDISNNGFVISPTIDNCNIEDAGMSSIKLVINTLAGSKNFRTFTCDVKTSVEHVISHVVCSMYDDMSDINIDNYILKVHGLAEYLLSQTYLFEYEYIHKCLKYDKTVEFDLLDKLSLKRPLARTPEDDVEDILNLCSPSLCQYYKPIDLSMKKESFVILLETFDKEVEKMRAHALNVNASEPLQVEGVIQAVKAICTILSCIETSLITESIECLRVVAELFSKADFDFEGCVLSLPFSVIDIAQDMPTSPNTKMEILQCALERINGAIWDLLEMYCKVFHVDFSVLPSTSHSQNDDCDKLQEKEIASVPDSVLIHVGTVHRIRPNWVSSFDQFQVMCTLYHGDRAISSAIATKPISISKSFYPRLHFDEWLNIDDALMCTLPRETRAVFKLYGIKMMNGDSKSSENRNKVLKVIGWNSVHLFSYDGYLVQGSVLYGLWPSSVKDITGSSISNTEDRHAPLLQINFPEFSYRVLFPPVLKLSLPSQAKDFDSLDIVTQTKLMEMIGKDILTPCTPEDKELLWDKRHHLYNLPEALPRVLLCAHSWDWACLSDIYNLLNEWKALQPVDALQLLLPSFPDIEVRKMAILWMSKLGGDELCDYLPQIVQALKFDTWKNSATVEFLLEKSLTNVRVAHHLYWLLKQCKNDRKYGPQMNLILKLLLAICGKAMRERFDRQEELMDNLTGIAERLKTTKESLRLQSLFRELESVHHPLSEKSTSLPLDPGLEVDGIEVKCCSYFPSNTLPLRLTFKAIGGGNIQSIYKVGDDLRQDSLTLQMIHIMDKLWLRDGLDLRIVTFQCIATGEKKGMMEMVTESETLRKIHTELGVTGSFKDRCISEWLQKNNPSELEFQQAIENFTHSCAGYAVATYILGICDRHNDNIMLKTSGHLFHIDFGKFLGDAQMFGNIKRDRVPFVLTPDMVFAINGGDKPSSKFQGFVDLCCQAFNIIRHNGNLFLNLFSLMASAGIPGVSMDAVKYIQNVLCPGQSDALATAHFARLIEDSTNAKSTQINFFIHNLSQLRFSGDHNDNALLSFVPKTYTMETEGRILSAALYGVQKRYDQEKYYVYIIKITRENQTDATYISRSYREFCEFDQKMHMTFPLAKFLSLPRDLHFGRSNIRQVADKRKIQIDLMLKSLFSMADEIAHHDTVYTFFHPLLRDQQESAAVGLQQQQESKLRRRESVSLGAIRGQIKLSLHYKGNILYIMVIHAKYLNCSKGVLPDSYVKTYLLPDPHKSTKKKTKIIRRNSHPTFMEMLIYELPLNVIRHCKLQVTVWHNEALQENEFLGCVIIDLARHNLSDELVSWYPLGII